MKYLSVCSGIEAATCAWHHMGWQPVGFSEIEPFPSAVLAHYYPQVPNLGDMTKYKEWDIGAIDLLVGGTPCQSFSVAGLRKGLEDPRGNLALVYCGILDHFKPRWFVWENVPGVLSSNGGRDFGSFLGAVAELGYGFAYRVLDAQYFGVAQRRRRVFVVGHLGDWEPAAKVLFEPESLRGNPAPSREKGKEVAGRFTHGLGVGGECARALTAAHTATGRLDPHEATFISQMEPVGVPEVMSTLLSSTAGISRPGNAATEHETYIPMAQPISIHPHCIGRSPEAGPQGKEYLTDGTAYCMDSRGQPQAVAFDWKMGEKARSVAFNVEQSPTLGAQADRYAVAQPIGFTRCDHGGDAVMDGTPTMRCGSNYSAHLAVAQPIPIHDQATRFAGKRGDKNDGKGNGLGIGNEGDPAPTLTKGDKHAVAQPIAFHPTQDPIISEDGTTHCMGTGNKQGGATVAVAVDVYNQAIDGQTAAKLTEACGGTNTSGPKVMQSMAVRRLTPKECERLQGFPDEYTLIPWRNKPLEDCPDGPRYKALGNSMAVPVMKWIGERMQ